MYKEKMKVQNTKTKALFRKYIFYTEQENCLEETLKLTVRG